MKNFKQFLILSESFIRENDLVELYELNYKYDMMKKSPFNGVPDRRENIINMVERKGLVVSNHVITELIKIFNSWLDDHALTSAETWAKGRIKDMGDEDDGYFIADPTDEYRKYRVSKPYSDDAVETGRLLNKYFRYLVDNNKLMDCALTKWFNTILSEHKDSYMTTLTSLDENDAEDAEEYKDFVSRIQDIDENPEKYITEYVGSTDILNYFELVKQIKNGIVDGIDLAKELYQYIVFPVWFDYWEKQGIVQTRKRIENITSDMKKAYKEQNLTEMFKQINIALHSAHQTGKMLDYISREHYDIDKSLLYRLTNMNVSELNSELKRQGFQIDSKNIWQPYNEDKQQEIKQKQDEKVRNDTKIKQILRDIETVKNKETKTEYDNNKLKRLTFDLEQEQKKSTYIQNALSQLINSYQQGLTNFSPILGKMFGGVKDGVKAGINALKENDQLSFNFKTGGSDIDDINKKINKQKDAIKLKIDSMNNQITQITKQIIEIEKQLDKNRKEKERIGNPENVQQHYNDLYNMKNVQTRKDILDRISRQEQPKKDKISNLKIEKEKIKKELSKLLDDYYKLILKI